MKRLIKNFSYTIISNVISFLISVIITFIVPKFLGVDSYGYFQLYLFYTTYIGFFHFGWVDGIYLRYGGEYYKNLDRCKFSSQFWLFSLFELIISIIISLSAYFFVTPVEKSLVIIFTAIAILLFLPRTFLQYVLQCTNRFKEYAIINITEKILYFLIIVFSLSCGIYSFTALIAADLIGKFFSTLYACYACKEIIISRFDHLPDIFLEAWNNISVGIKLTFANISSLLIIGIIRFSIEREWDVATFGKISLTMSVSNMLMVLVKAISLVLFPTLRRSKKDNLPKIYDIIRTSLMVPLLGLLITYFPLNILLNFWLPQYSDSLVYMAMLFPICIYECKMSLLIQTYFNTLRKESLLLKVNLISLLLSCLLTYINVYILHNLEIVVLSIVFLLAFRCILGEIILSKIIKINIFKDTLLEILLSVIFILAGWFYSDLVGMCIYSVAYIFYLLVKRSNIYSVFSEIVKRS